VGTAGKRAPLPTLRRLQLARDGFALFSASLPAGFPAIFTGRGCDAVRLSFDHAVLPAAGRYLDLASPRSREKKEKKKKKKIGPAERHLVVQRRRRDTSRLIEYQPHSPHVGWRLGVRQFEPDIGKTRRSSVPLGIVDHDSIRRGALRLLPTRRPSTFALKSCRIFRHERSAPGADLTSHEILRHVDIARSRAVSR